MSEDYLINLLPSEYLPKPEFKGFIVFFIVLISAVALFCFQDYTRLQRNLETWQFETKDLQTTVQRRFADAQTSMDIQARSRMLLSYAVSIWVTLHQNPPWIDVYNEIEENIPEGMWIENLKLVGGSEKKWPSFNMVGMVAGKEPETLLDFYEKMLDKDSKFDKVKISGYTYIKRKGQDAITFNMTFSIKKTSFLGF
jgi:hypothetical protein